jgi:5-methylcytosine-specific restriction protein A
MPSKSPTPCRCGRKVVSHGKCETCLSKSRRQIDRVRGNAGERGYGHDHREQFRLAVLKRDRWICRMCGGAAVAADHYPSTRRELVAAGLNPNDPQYGRALCTTCHNRHTAKATQAAARAGRRPS